MPETSRYGSVIAAISLIGAALMLASGVYAFNYFTSETAHKTDITFYDDDANDRVIVRSSESDSDWGKLSIESDVPVRVSLGVQTLTAGPSAVPLPPRLIVDGESFNVCTLGPESDVNLTFRDVASGEVVTTQNLRVHSCAVVL